MNIKTMLAALAFAASGTTALANETWTTDGFDMPESALVDSVRDRIILSTIVGHPGEADGKGKLVLLALDGSVLDASWTTGLDAPKGMAIVGDTLLVADLNRLHEVDLATGKVRRTLTHPDTVFLNDITSDGEVAYISDFMTHSLWQYEQGDLSLWLKDSRLSHPNGVFLDGGRLLVGSWGAEMQDDFTTVVPGSLLSVALDTQKISVIAPEIGNLDGITRIGAAIIVSDWVTGGMLAISDNGQVSRVAQHAPGLADISSNGDMLYLPMMLNGSLSSFSYP